MILYRNGVEENPNDIGACVVPAFRTVFTHICKTVCTACSGYKEDGSRRNQREHRNIRGIVALWNIQLHFSTICFSRFFGFGRFFVWSWWQDYHRFHFPCGPGKASELRCYKTHLASPSSPLSLFFCNTVVTSCQSGISQPQFAFLPWLLSSSSLDKRWNMSKSWA